MNGEAWLARSFAGAVLPDSVSEAPPAPQDGRVEAQARHHRLARPGAVRGFLLPGMGLPLGARPVGGAPVVEQPQPHNVTENTPPGLDYS